MAWADCWPLADPPLICIGGGLGFLFGVSVLPASAMKSIQSQQDALRHTQRSLSVQSLQPYGAKNSFI